MTIASLAEAVALRNAAAHRFHQIQQRTVDPGTSQMLEDVADMLRALDLYVVEQLKPHDDVGVVVPLDGTPKS